jgi:hypothetical protein
MANKRKLKTTKTSRLHSLKESVGDKRIPKVIGVLCLLLSIYLLVAFVSYLFTWKSDQDQVFNFSWGLFFDDSLKVENLLGRFGAIVSNVFFYWGVGLASFISIFLLFKLGFLLLVGKSLRGMWSPFQYSLTFVLFFSPLLAFILGNSAFPWGGVFGEYVSAWLIRFVGTVGTVLLFVFLGIAFFVWNFHHLTEKSTFSFKWPKFSFKRRPETDPPLDDDDWFDAPTMKKESPTQRALVNELDEINKTALEFDLPRAEKKTLAKETQHTALEVVEVKPQEPRDPEMEPLVMEDLRETPGLIVEKGKRCPPRAL